MVENRDNGPGPQTGGAGAGGGKGLPGRRWMPVALAVSLALNLLVAGVFLGVRLNPPARPADSPPAQTADPARLDARLLRDLGLGPFMNAFPPQARRQMARRIRAEVGTLNDGRQALVAELDEMLALMRADPFDAEALAQVVERQKQRLNRRTDIGREIVLEAITEMTPEERRAFADRLERVLRRALAKTPRQVGAPRPPRNGQGLVQGRGQGAGSPGQ